MEDLILEHQIQNIESSRRHPAGRPPKLTTELIEEVCDLIFQGYSIASAAKYRRISESSIYRWLALGKAPNAEAIYKELLARVKEACEFSEFEALHRIKVASINSKHWRAAAWILERRFPDSYAADRKQLAMSDYQEAKIEPSEQS